MSARPDTWMPMYWGDYVRDTGHLNAAGHGAYLMLIKHYWCTGGPLADDDDELWRIACCDSRKEWLGMRPRIVRLFIREDRLLRHKRIDKELRAAAAAVTAKAEAGKKGAEKRWQKDSTPIDLPLPNDGFVNGERMTEPMERHVFANAPSPSPSPKEDSDLRSAAPDAAPTIREALWRDGLPIIRALIGSSDAQARAFLGKLLKASHDDCARVYGAVREAESLKPVDPKAWLAKAALPLAERNLLDAPVDNWNNY